MLAQSKAQGKLAKHFPERHADGDLKSGKCGSAPVCTENLNPGALVMKSA